MVDYLTLVYLNDYLNIYKVDHFTWHGTRQERHTTLVAPESV
jgi:hypothetical protein